MRKIETGLAAASIALSVGLCMTAAFAAGAVVGRTNANTGRQASLVETYYLEHEVPVAAPVEPAEPIAEPVYMGEFEITHYCACERCCGKQPGTPAYGITATGTVATEGRTIAVDPDVIPYGSEVAIYYEDGTIGRYIAEDCGGAIKGNRIDVYMADHQAALEAGVVTGSVYVEVEP